MFGQSRRIFSRQHGPKRLMTIAPLLRSRNQPPRRPAATGRFKLEAVYASLKDGTVSIRRTSSNRVIPNRSVDRSRRSAVRHTPARKLGLPSVCFTWIATHCFPESWFQDHMGAPRSDGLQAHRASRSRSMAAVGLRRALANPPKLSQQSSPVH